VKLDLSNIKDEYVRENFRLLQEYVDENAFLDGFRHMDFLISGAVTNQKIRHGLGFVPKDIIRTQITGPGVLTFNYDLFDDEFLDVSSNGDCRVRALVGTYKGSGATPDD
jgi:hypothetical protein